MSLRRCTESDRAAILSYIAAEPEINLFIYGDIESVGVDRDPVHVFVPVGEAAGQWSGLLLQYYENYLYYSCDPGADLAPFVEFLQGRRVENLNAKGELAHRLAPYFPTLRPTDAHMSRCNAETCAPAGPLPAGLSVRRLGKAEVDEVLELLRGVEEFSDTYRGDPRERERMARHLDMGGMIYGGCLDGRLVATAQTTAASSRSAMVISVATRPDARGRGYASAVVSALCRDNFAAGRQFLCLFYDNPAAGRIYHRIGFRDVGVYTILGAAR